MTGNNQHTLFLLLMPLLLLLPPTAAAQGISRLNVPSGMCDNDSLLVRFGYASWNEVVMSAQESSLGHVETVFLPDGVPCNGNCSYRSPVTFTAFRTGDTIRTPNDIKYVRIKMEHSYMGDIYIKVECPDGKKADLLRFAGTGVSDCLSEIPAESRLWHTGSNASDATFLGNALDEENTDFPCDAMAAGNGPGTGWNYCWSNNTNSGFNYAPGDGYIYRFANQHNGRIDSSDVAARTNFFHPDEHFGALVGCPLNGTWSVTVMDGYTLDNGYIFEWELSLDASLLPPADCEPDSFFVLGGAAVRTSDTSFLLLPPPELSRDTTVQYTFRVTTTCGDTIDSVRLVTYHPTPEEWLEDEVCQGRGYYIAGQTLYGGGEHTIAVPLASGCDSTIHLTLTEHPSYDFHLYDSVCVNNSILFEGTEYSRPGDYVHQYSTVHGCDSVLTMHLTVHDTALHARIKATPQVLEPEQPRVHLYDASQNHVARQWTVGTLATSDKAELTVDFPPDADSLTVTLVAISAHQCADTDTVVVRMDRSMVTVPNVFTPVLETNNRWKPVAHDVTEMEVWVYNRAGQPVAHLEGTDDAWDGCMPDGTPCPQGSYLYTMRYCTQVHPSRPMIRTGSVTLIR